MLLYPAFSFSSLMFRYKMTLAYDGTLYCGWQIQHNGVSIQALVEEALSTALRRKVAVVGSSRTDAGVHAQGQVAHFTTEQEVDTARTALSLNGLLPKDIRVLSIEEVPQEFHARYSASGKIYHYHIHQDKVMYPAKRLYATHIFSPLNLSALCDAAALFVGRHNFASFANEQHKGCAAKNPVRTLRRLECKDEPGGYRLEFEGDGFLYKMVRNIVGTLLEVGRGKLSPAQVIDILAAKDRRAAPASAPPQGLFLFKIHY